jgi:putative FmdB family regulatory protein
MPLYEYVCQLCGRRFEVRQGFDGHPPAMCPAGHHDVRRLLEPTPVHFKGSGFYVTDNRKPDNGRTR